MKEYLQKYKQGIDFWALIAVVMVVLPEIVYACIPAFTGLFPYHVPEIFARIFQAAGCILLVFFVLREPPEKKPFFDSLYMTATLALLLDYTAWILYFCGITTFGVVIFLKVCPCVFLLLLTFEKKNALAAIPLAAYSLISIVSFCIAVVSGTAAF